MNLSVLCFRIFSVTKKFMDKRAGGGGEFQDFLPKIFCLTVPKNSIRESFTVAIISGNEKVCIRGGEEYQDFPSKFFCLTVPKNFIEKPFSASVIAGTEKVWIRERGGVSRFSVESFLSHRAVKIRTGNLIVFH